MYCSSIKYFLPYGIDGGPEGKVGRGELWHEHISLGPDTHNGSESLAVETTNRSKISLDIIHYGN